MLFASEERHPKSKPESESHWAEQRLPQLQPPIVSVPVCHKDLPFLIVSYGKVRWNVTVSVETKEPTLREVFIWNYLHEHAACYGPNKS